MSTSLLQSLSKLSFSSTSKPAVILNPSNIEEFIKNCILLYSPLDSHIQSILEDENYVRPGPPKWDQKVKFGDEVIDIYLYAELVNGVLVRKTDTATLEAFQKVYSAYEQAAKQTRLVESVVLKDFSARISPTSLALVSSYSTTFATDQLDLQKMVNMVKKSHSKSNSVAMLEALHAFFKAKMGQPETFYAFTDLMAVNKKHLNTVYAAYLNEPLSKFFDLISSMVFVSGLNKASNVFEQVILNVRAMDLQTPAAQDLYPDIMSAAVKAYFTKDLMSQSYETTNTPFQGMTVSTETPNNLMANSTLTAQTMCSCKNVLCGKLIPVVVDVNGNALKNFCAACFAEYKAKRYGKYAADMKAGKSIPAGDVPVPAAPVPAKKAIIPKKPTTPGLTKPAKASTFTGTNQNVALSVSQEFLHDYQRTDSDEAGDSPY